MKATIRQQRHQHQLGFRFLFRFQYSFVFLVLLIGFSSGAFARKLLDDNDSAVMDQRSVRDDSDSEKSTSEIRTPYKEAETPMEMRKLRRVALGLQAEGALGVGGALMELALSPQWSFNAGYGGGSGYQAVEVQGKYVLAGDWLMPYLSFGYARWINSGNNGPITQTTPAALGDRLLTASEKASGEFQKNLLYPGIGLQYMMLSGDWAGSSVYAELTVLMDVGDFVTAPVGALGFLYYF